MLGSNVWSGRYELDLILRRGRRLVFAEVKAKRGPRFGDPLEMVTEEKLRRLTEAAELWLAARPDCAGLELGFEVVAISPAGLRRVPLT